MSFLWNVKSSLSTELIIGSIALLIGGALVTVGIVGENRKSSLEFVASWHPRFIKMVVIGVAIELLADGLIFFSSYRLEILADQKVAALQAENIGLQKVLAPRRIVWVSRDNDEAKRTELFNALKVFSGTRVFIQYVPDFEATRLAYEIFRRIQQAGMTPEFIDERVSHFGPLVIGDGVDIHSTNDAFAAGQALSKLFALDLGEGPNKLVLWNDMSMHIGPYFGPGMFNAPENSLLVLVGMKESEWNFMEIRIKAEAEANSK
ncbi:MAG: hypothetical protein ACLQO1_01830 [Steroidobacteraceae bacterium]